MKEGSAFILPKFITLSNKDNYNYLSVDSSNSLAFDKVLPDANCTFEVSNLPYGRISLKGANGKIINLSSYSGASSGWFRCEGNKGGCEFDVIYVKKDEIYLQSWSTPRFFMTDYQSDVYQGLYAYPYADDHCLFIVSTPTGTSKET